MTTFEYKGIDNTGRGCRGLIEALDLKDAREKLAARGILVEKIQSAGQSETQKKRGGFNLGARAMIYRELGALLHAGLPLAHALEVLIESPELGENRGQVAGLRDRIREGAGLANALGRSSAKVTPFEQAIIEVGERAGTLEVVLDRVALFLEEQQRVRERIQTALIYPAIIFTMGIVIAVIMLGVMIPRISKMLVETGVPLPFVTRGMMAVGTWFFPVILPLIAVAVIGFFFMRYKLAREIQLRERWDRTLFKMPLIGQGYAALASLRFCRTLALLLHGGVSLVDGVGLAGRATGSSWIGRLAGESAESIRHGKNLADAIRSIPPLSLSLPGWIQAGEAGGNLQFMLDNAGNRFQLQWDRLVTRSLTILEPLLILLVGGFVLLVALSILLPVLSLNRMLM